MFRSYIAALTAEGMDAYVVFYYSDADAVAMGSADHAVRAKTFQNRVEAWARLVGDVVGYALGRPETNGRVGVLGVSNGATLGVAAAARDARISALVACYGSFPPIQNVRRMPPLLVLHGDADQVIPPIAGKELVDYAKALGGFTNWYRIQAPDMGSTSLRGRPIRREKTPGAAPSSSCRNGWQ
jgi:carboxymethylenebutenolidase